MRLWRLTRAAFSALDGSGPMRHGARYSSPGRPVVNFASEAGLAVLVALRYLPEQRAGRASDYVLGWTDVDAVPERVPDTAGADGEDGIRAWVDHWLDTRCTLLAAIPSRVLPEADIVMMNPLHPAARAVQPLTCRPFDFDACLHRPPMREIYRQIG